MATGKLYKMYVAETESCRGSVAGDDPNVWKPHQDLDAELVLLQSILDGVGREKKLTLLRMGREQGTHLSSTFSEAAMDIMGCTAD